jgi:hypothetical protein
MRKIRLNELNEAVRSFLAQVVADDTLVIEDESGQPLGSFIPHRESTAAEKQQAQQSLEHLRQKTGQAMKKHGVTEDDIIRVILEDD